MRARPSVGRCRRSVKVPGGGAWEPSTSHRGYRAWDPCGRYSFKRVSSLSLRDYFFFRHSHGCTGFGPPNNSRTKPQRAAGGLHFRIRMERGSGKCGATRTTRSPGRVIDIGEPSSRSVSFSPSIHEKTLLIMPPVALGLASDVFVLVDASIPPRYRSACSAVHAESPPVSDKDRSAFRREGSFP